MSLASHIEEFLAFVVAERGLSANTAAAYRKDLQQFRESAERRGGLSAQDLCPAHALDYAEALKGRSLRESSIARKLAALHSFAKFLVMNGNRADDFMEGMEGRKRGRPLPRGLSVRNMARLLEGMGVTEAGQLRDRALCEMLYGSGVRASELCGLRIRDLDLDARRMRVTGKGNKERIVPLCRGACEFAALYLKQRAQAVRGSGARAAQPLMDAREARSEFLFPGRRGGPLNRRELFEIVRRGASRAGIQSQVSPHTLRHAYASHLLRNGADLRVIQELLGHARVTTTQIYTHIADDRLKQIYLKFHPRA